MKTLRKVVIEPVYVEFIPEKLEENKVYISEEYKCSAHLCLCGCGEKTILPLDAIIDGKDLGWHLVKERDQTISFTPSIGNYQLPCRSHYIITRNVANFV